MSICRKSSSSKNCDCFTSLDGPFLVAIVSPLHEHSCLLCGATSISAVSCKTHFLLCRAAGMSAFWHSRRVCCVTWQTCLLCYTADRTTAWHRRDVLHIRHCLGQKGAFGTSQEMRKGICIYIYMYREYEYIYIHVYGYMYMYAYTYVHMYIHMITCHISQPVATGRRSVGQSVGRLHSGFLQVLQQRRFGT